MKGLAKVSLAGLALGLVALASAAPDWAGSVPGSVLGIQTWQWIYIVGIAILGFLCFELVHFLGGNILRLRERLTGHKSKVAQRTIRRGAGLLAFVVPWYLFFDVLELSPGPEKRVFVTIEVVTIVAVLVLVIGVWDDVCDTISHRATGVANAERLLIPVVRRLVRFVILIAGVLVVLEVFGVSIPGLLAGIGIGGLVVALAAKDSVENIFGSLTILFDMPFAIGDWVKIDKYEGIVEQINLRSTKIRTFEDSMITLPNSNLIRAAVENYGARRYRRQRFEIRLSYANHAENLHRFMDLVRAYLDELKEAVPNRTVVELNDMTEMSIGILVQCFVEASTFQEEMKIRNDLMLAIFRAQEQTGIVFVGTPIPAPEEKPHKLSKEMEKIVEDKEDII